MIILESGCPQFAHASGDFQGGYVTVECVNKELRDWFSSLDRAFGHPNEFSSDPSDHAWFSVDPNNPKWTHKCRITKPVPIVRDSFELIAMDLLHINDDPVFKYDAMNQLADRARKLLERK